MAKPGNNKGTSNFRAKLNEADVLIIFKSNKSQSKLAEEYNVSQGTISHIKKGRTWVWLTSR